MKKRLTSAPLNFSVIAPAEGKEAEVLIYGIIGEDWWGEPDEQNTAENIALTLADLGERYDVVNIRLNSPGGDVVHGLAIINAMKRCKAKVVTWNDGLAASMASGIWLAGEERHMAENAMLMIHSPINFCWGNALEMRACADLLDKWEESFVAQLAERLGIEQAEVKAEFFDGEDHWITFNGCVNMGLCPMPKEPEDNYQSASAKAEINGRRIEELYALYRAESPDPKRGRGNMLARIRAMLGIEATALPPEPEPSTQSQIEDFDMTKEELTAAMVEALAAHEAAKTASAAAAQQPDGGDDDPLKVLSARLDVLATENAALKTQVAALGEEPAAKPAAGALPPTEPDPANAGVKAMHERAVADYQAGIPVRFVD